MAERDFSVLEQYDCKLYSTSRGRGAFICETSRGRLLLREYGGSPEKIKARAALLEYLADGGINVDYLLKNNEGQYVSVDLSGTGYIVSTWFDAAECDIKNFSDVCTAMAELAQLHRALEGYTYQARQECGGDGQEFQIARNLTEVYDKHNKELKMIGNYLKTKKKKNDLELLAAAKCQPFLEEGLEASGVIAGSGYDKGYDDAVRTGRLCHGDFNYHNIFIRKQCGYICGFEQSCVNLRLVDLYGFMRKLMEKYDWDIKLGYLMLREYDKVNALSSGDIKILGAMFAYPEKFWKILNYYFNANKAWIPNKNMEKLKLAVKQNRMRREFVRTLYGS